MHRDFKLDNLLLHNGKVIIADFGLSKAGQDLTTTPAGTADYMAPEILEKQIYQSKAET